MWNSVSQFSYGKNTLKNFTKFKGKDLCLHLIKLEGWILQVINRDTPTQMSWEFCKLFSEQLLLKRWMRKSLFSSFKQIFGQVRRSGGLQNYEHFQCVIFFLQISYINFLIVVLKVCIQEEVSVTISILKSNL